MILIIVLSSLALLILLLVILFAVQRSRRKPLKTGKLTENLYTVQTRGVNFYIYKEGEDVVAFDSGYAGSEAEFKQIDIDPARIGHVFLTHTDLDHTGGLVHLKNAKICIGKDEEQMIDHSRIRMFGIVYNNLPPRHYKLLADGEEVAIGKILIKAIATPGHTPGSMSYLVNGKILIVGDTLNLVKGEAALFTRMFTMDPDAQAESIRKLARLDGISVMCTGHSGCTKDFDKAMEKWRE